MNISRVVTLPMLPGWRNKLLAGLIIFCIGTNVLVPKFAIESADPSVLNRIMQCQTTLLKFFSLSSLPEKIVTDLFTGNTNRAAARPAQAPKHDDRRSTNTSADYSLLGSDAKTLSRCSFFRAVSVNDALTAFVPALGIPLERAESSPPGGDVLAAIICVFFFLLPRSSLSDGTGVISSLVLGKTRLARSSRVFLFIEAFFSGASYAVLG